MRAPLREPSSAQQDNRQHAINPVINIKQLISKQQRQREEKKINQTSINKQNEYNNNNKMHVKKKRKKKKKKNKRKKKKKKKKPGRGSVELRAGKLQRRPGSCHLVPPFNTRRMGLLNYTRPPLVLIQPSKRLRACLFPNPGETLHALSLYFLSFFPSFFLSISLSLLPPFQLQKQYPKHTRLDDSDESIK